jgi:hypothetical protein
MRPPDISHAYATEPSNSAESKAITATSPSQSFILHQTFATCQALYLRDTWCMWSTDTPWFEVAVMTTFLAAGNILFGHFEEHKAKWRRLLKVALFAG